MRYRLGNTVTHGIRSGRVLVEATVIERIGRNWNDTDLVLSGSFLLCSFGSLITQSGARLSGQMRNRSFSPCSLSGFLMFRFAAARCVLVVISFEQKVSPTKARLFLCTWLVRGEESPNQI